VLRGDSENQLVRTFRPRRRRLGAEIGAVYESLIDRYRIDEVGDRVDLGSVFGDGHRVMLEIGCGRGDLAVSFATQHRDVNLVAIDVHTRGIANILDGVRTNELTNVRVVEGDAQVFVRRLTPRTLDEIWVFFPDPWPKIRHRNRRLLRDDLVLPLTDSLRVGGVLRFATDIEDYARTATRAIAESKRFSEPRHERPEWRIETVFERRGRLEGRPSIDLCWTRISES